MRTMAKSVEHYKSIVALFGAQLDNLEYSVNNLTGGAPAPKQKSRQKSAQSDPLWLLKELVRELREKR